MIPEMTHSDGTKITEKLWWNDFTPPCKTNPVWIVLYLFRWQYTVNIIICVIYIPRHSLESVIVKYSKYPHRCGDWQKHIYLKTSDSSAPEPCRSTTHTIKIILQAAAIPGFQTEMATERQNLRTASLNEQQINKAVFVFSWKKLD